MSEERKKIVKAARTPHALGTGVGSYMEELHSVVESPHTARIEPVTDKSAEKNNSSADDHSSDHLIPFQH